MNKVFLTGRITKDLEIRKTQTNKSVLSFSIAVDKGTKDQNGNREAIFVDIQAWEHTAEYLGQYAKKGTMIAVVGKINIYTATTQSGDNIKKTNVVAEHVEIMSWNNQGTNETKQTITRKQDFTGGGYEEIKSEDLPFY